MTRYWTYITAYHGVDEGLEESWGVGTWHYSIDNPTEKFDYFSPRDGGVVMLACGVYVGETSGMDKIADDIKNLMHLVDDARKNKLEKLTREGASDYDIYHIHRLKECISTHGRKLEGSHGAYVSTNQKCKQEINNGGRQ